MDPQAESADVFSPNWPQDAHIFSHKILMPELVRGNVYVCVCACVYVCMYVCM